MIIHRLKLRQFKRFNDYEISLQPGLNVIKGPNESGKSTLLEALISCFFYDTTAKIEGYRTWNSPEQPKLELEFSVDQQGLILKKDFEETAVSLGYSDGSKEEATLKKIKKLLTGFLGFDTDRAFLATSCIRQHELDTVVAESLPFRLENILLGGSASVDVSAVIKQLADAAAELKRKGAKNPGPLVTLPPMIQELEGPLNRIGILESERAKLNRELTQLEEKYRPKSILMERAQGYKKWKDENGRLVQEFNNIHNKLAELKELQEKETAYSMHFKNPNHAEELNMKIFNYKLTWHWWLVFILTLGIGYIIYKIKIRQILKQANCATIGQFHRVYAEYKELQKQKIKMEGYSPDELEKEETDISRRLAVNEAQAAPDIDLVPEELIKLEEEVKTLQEKIRRHSNQCHECEIRIREITRGKGEQIEIEEKLESLKEALGRARRRLAVLSLARDTMEKARCEVLLSSIESFNKEIAGSLASFTHGRYTRIKTDIIEGGIRFLIYSQEKDEWVSPEELSTGTQDQLYLAARITLLKLVASHRHPPLVMDDPFTSFDHDRLDSAMQVCAHISKEYQIILFTCTGRYDRYANNIIQLEYEPQKISTL